MKDSIIKYIKSPSHLLYKIETVTNRKFKINDKTVIKLQYKECFNERLNLKKPKKFSEKLAWLKLYDRKDIYTIMVDKYEAKKYVSSLIGEKYIIPTYGIWNNFNDIDFDKLPSQFVLKCTHDSGGNVICRDKSKFDKQKAKEKIENCLNVNYYYKHREWPYKNVKPRIIAEKYMEDSKQSELIDYKFYCFNQKPRILYISQGLENHETAKISFVELNYKKSELKREDFKEFDNLPPKPINFEEMKEIASILSKDKCFLRVDLYEINGIIYFSELTPYPGAGLVKMTPKKYEQILGDYLDISNVKRK